MLQFVLVCTALARVVSPSHGQIPTAPVGVSTLDIRSGDQVFVDRGGWFEHNQQFVVGTVLSVTGIIITILRR